MYKLLDNVGNTPLIKLSTLSKQLGVGIYAKYEAANPSGSIKARAAKMMILAAEDRGEISPKKTTLVEPTSGNTEIAIAMVAAARGYKCIICMPETMSVERRKTMGSYGAKIVLTKGDKGLQGSVDAANKIVKENKNAWLVGQFDNPDNPLCHELETGPEIYEELGFVPEYLITGSGTGGTITGITHYFRKLRRVIISNARVLGSEEEGKLAKMLVPKIQAYAVEPSTSAIISQKKAHKKIKPGAHGIQGIGPNFVPGVLDTKLLAGAISVSTQDAINQAKWLSKHEGLQVGISSGANVAAIRKFVKDNPDVKNKTIITVLPDAADRYMSTALFS